MSRLSGLGSLAPLGKSSRTSADFDQSADSDFGALLDDILDSPTHFSSKGNRRAGSKKSSTKSSSSRENRDVDDLNDSIGSSSLPSPPKLRSDNLESSLNISDSISPVRDTITRGFDKSTPPSPSVDLSGTNDELEDSILGAFGPSKKKGPNKVKTKSENLPEPKSLKPGSNQTGLVSISSTTREFSRPRTEDSSSSPARTEDTKVTTPKLGNDDGAYLQSRGSKIDERRFSRGDNEDSNYGAPLTTGFGSSVSLGNGRTTTSAQLQSSRDPTKNTDDVEIGFMPSFLEPGRQSRQRRFVIVHFDPFKIFTFTCII